jgi:hypothetical protein
VTSAKRSLSILAPACLLLVALTTWVVWYPPSPDLAAQVYRIHLFSTDGFTLWDNAWYGGHYVPSYSLLFPPLASMLGLRATGALAVSFSVWAFSRLIAGRPERRAALASSLFAIGALGDLFIGRVTFALGVALGLASVLAIAHRRRLPCAALSLACAAASPVAAAFLVLVATGDLLANRSRMRFALLAGPPLALAGASLLLFGEQGYEPFALGSMLAALGASTVVFVLVSPKERFVRCTALLYALALLLAYALRSPMGSNAVRFGVLFAPAALAACVGSEDVQRVIAAAAGRFGRVRRMPRVRPARRAAARSAPGLLLALIGCALVLWQLTGPVAQSVGASDELASRARFYSPAIRYLESRSAGRPMRVEVPFTKSHWDAAVLADHFDLARGWDRQLDTTDNALFYEGQLTAPAYRQWLHENAVRFVALSDAPLDFSSIREAALVRAGLPFLRLAFHSAHWRIYEVLAASRLSSGPARVTHLSGDGFSLSASGAGRSLVRVHFTAYWTVTAGQATVARAAGGWTEVTTSAAGKVVIDADFPLGL